MSTRWLARTQPKSRHAHLGEHSSRATATATPEQNRAAGGASSYSLSAKQITYAAAMGLALVGMIALTATVVTAPGPGLGDVGLTIWWQHLVLPHPGLTRLLEIDSTLNWPQPAGIIIATTIALFMTLLRWLDAALALATVAIADATNVVINQVIQRPRPVGHGVYVDQHITGIYSYPSGHVEHAIAFYGIVLFLTFQVQHVETRTNVLLWIVRVALILSIVLMGPSRVLMGEHWPSDALAGLLWGGFWLLGAIRVYSWLTRRWPRLLGIGEPRPDQKATA